MASFTSDTSWEARDFRPPFWQDQRARPEEPAGQGWMATSPALVQFQCRRLERVGLQWVEDRSEDRFSVTSTASPLSFVEAASLFSSFSSVLSPFVGLDPSAKRRKRLC